MDDGANTGHCQGIAVVNVADASVGVGAGQQPGVEHPAQIYVVYKGGVALGEFDGIYFGFGFTNNGRFRDIALQHNIGLRLYLRLHVPPAAATRHLWRG